jgi:hypothetical protein
VGEAEWFPPRVMMMDVLSARGDAIRWKATAAFEANSSGNLNCLTGRSDLANGSASSSRCADLVGAVQMFGKSAF